MLKGQTAGGGGSKLRCRKKTGREENCKVPRQCYGCVYFVLGLVGHTSMGERKVA
jgi:hypothetical protein